MRTPVSARALMMYCLSKRKSSEYYIVIALPVALLFACLSLPVYKMYALSVVVVVVVDDDDAVVVVVVIIIIVALLYNPRG